MERCNCENAACSHDVAACANATNTGRVAYLGAVCLDCWLGYGAEYQRNAPTVTVEGEAFLVISAPYPDTLLVRTRRPFGTDGPTMHIDKPEPVPNGRVIAERWTAERNTLAREIKSARVTYKREAKEPPQPRHMAQLVRVIFRSNLRHVPMNPTRRGAVLRAFVNCLRFSREPIPYNLPCGADDAFGERQDHARVVAAELRAIWKATA